MRIKSMNNLICYANGSFMPLDEAGLPVTDLGILRGYGVFDFLRTYNGLPFKLREHLHRLENSARIIGMTLPWAPEQLEDLVLQTLHRNWLDEAFIRIIVTGGQAEDGITPMNHPSLIIIVSPVQQYPPDYYSEGVNLITVDLNRILHDAKTINYIPAIMALQRATAVGAADALYVDSHDNLLEGTTVNFFIFLGSQLITPVDGILKGITREVVLELARDHFEIVERPISRVDLSQGSEAFITSSSKEVMPVRQVDQQLIGTGVVGSNTKLLMRLFHEYATSGAVASVS